MEVERLSFSTSYFSMDSVLFARVLKYRTLATTSGFPYPDYQHWNRDHHAISAASLHSSARVHPASPVPPLFHLSIQGYDPPGAAQHDDVRRQEQSHRFGQRCV